MGDIILRGDNPLWFVDESTELMEYKHGGLANQIFELVDKKMFEDKKNIILSLVKSSPAVAELVKGMKKTERLQLVFSDEVQKKIANGTYRLMKRKDVDGIFKAVVVDGKGKVRAMIR